MSRYGFIAKFKTVEGKRDEFVSLLLEASKLMEAELSCHQYILYTDPLDQNLVYASEIWDTKEDHDNSLKNEKSKALIIQGMKLLNGKPEGTGLEVAGGKFY